MVKSKDGFTTLFAEKSFSAISRRVFNLFILTRAGIDVNTVSGMSTLFLTDMNGTAARILSARSQSPAPFEETAAGGVCVIEITGTDFPDQEIVKTARDRGCDIVAVAVKGDDTIFEWLRKNGIARFLDHTALATYPAIPESASVWEKILLIDDDRNFGAMISSIGGLFGYRVERIVDGKTAVERLNEDHAFVIHNLSLGNIDLMDFIRRAGSTRLPSIPYLAFLHDGNQVSLRELHSGIGRLTKTIMTRGEVLSVLSYNLAMREFRSRMDEYAQSAFSQTSEVFSGNKIRGIFFANRDVFYHGKAAMDADVVLNAVPSIDRARESLAKLASLRWLITDHDE